MRRDTVSLPGLLVFVVSCLLFGAGVHLVQGEALAQSRSVPAQVGSLLDEAYTLVRAGRTEEAVAAFLRVLEIDPENRTARLELGYLNAGLGRWAEAVKFLASVSRREPDNRRLKLDLAYALQHAGELEQAEGEFRVLAESPGEFQAEAERVLTELREIRVRKTEEALRAREVRRDELLNRGYALLREGDREGARRDFEAALAEDPENVTILKQLGYLDLADGEFVRAARYFQTAWAYAPDDHRLALELGYIYARLGEMAKAESAFRGALPSPDPEISRAAQLALANVRAAQRVWFLDIYGSPFYTTRFSNFIGFYEVQLHWRPRPDSPFSLYLGHRLTRDTRSEGGELPQIFSDNVALFGPGIRIHPPGWHLSFRAEVNVAVNLVRTPDSPRSESDFRAILAYYRRWDGNWVGPLGGITLGQISGERLFTDVDVSVGYYSRFDDNVIGYLQFREGLRLVDAGPSTLAGYWRLNLAKDTNRDFFNNLTEVGVGADLHPFRGSGVILRGEYLRGFYFGIEGRDLNPFGSTYDDFRFTLVFSRRF